MKPLELTVYPPVPECPQQSGWGYARDDWFDDRAAERKLSKAKRLTGAELAAEVFRQAAWIGAGGRAHRTDAGRNIVFDAAFTFGPITRDEYEWMTASRFAALPHYDEAAP